jgi:hypothetical protein
MYLIKRFISCCFPKKDTERVLLEEVVVEEPCEELKEVVVTY